MVISILIFVVVLALLNTTKSLADLDTIPDEDDESVLGASVTSIQHYPEEESFIYQLSDEELEELFQVLSEQKVNRSYFHSSTQAEYYLTISSRESHTIYIGNDLIEINDRDQTYDLKSDELFWFISNLNK